MDPAAALPPLARHDPEMERQVLGSMLLDDAAAETASHLLVPADFHHGAHREIFLAARRLLSEGKPVSAPLLREDLAAAGRLEEVGGAAYLAEISAAVASSAHAAHYCQSLRRLATERRIQAFALEVRGASEQPGRRPAETLAAIRKGLDDLEAASTAGFQQSRELAASLGEVDRMLEGRREVLKPRGFEELCRLLPGHGLWPGLYVLGGPPGVGKTTLAVQLVDAALQSDPAARALVVSGEMSDADLFLSCISRRADIDLSLLLEGALSEGARTAAHQAAMDFAQSVQGRFRVLGHPLQVSRIRAEARATRPDLLVVDYLQLLEPEGDYAMAKDRIDAVARELQLLRSENPELPIILLASHNRGEAKKPYAPGRGLGAYKETGNIEYTADRCLNLEYEEEDYQRWRNGQLGDVIHLNLILLKNRMGRPGRVGMDFVGRYQTFTLGQALQYGPGRAQPEAKDG